LKKVLAADLFCGAGGASTGFVRACNALGLDYDLLAINHWPVAVETHSANHPGVRHLCESIERVDPREAVPGGRLHLLLAGPECTHFSTARGGRPVNPQSRASAWHILKWAQELYIDTILIENVPEFRTWGPVGTNGKPMKSKRGETYRAFIAALRSLDYKVEDRILVSADYGDPTTRKRLFIMARRGRHQIAWPAPTHSKAGGAHLFGQTKKWRGAREVIDWSIPGKSIFHRKKPLKPATIARILAGLEKFGGPELQPFLVVLRNNQTAQSVDGPVPTLTTSGANVGVAQPFLMHITHGRDANRSRSVDDPTPTLTGAKRGELALVDAYVLGQHGGSVLRPADEPLQTIACDGAIALVEPVIVDAAFGPGSESRRAASIDAPLGTIPGSNRFALAQPYIVPFLGERDGQNPRVKSIDEPLQAVTTRNPIGLAQPFITKYYATATGAQSVEDPLDTVTTRDRFGVVEPFVLQQQSNGAPRSTEEPLPTIATAGKQALVEPFVFANLTNNAPLSLDQPVPALCTGDHIALVQPVIEVEGTRYVLDIRFRMLQPHELAAATSFPKSYVFHGTREDVVKQIGNSWTGELSFWLNLAAIADYAPASRRRANWRDEATA
jgi:DNA (cytosine-5)-methyltransferase 1